MKIIDKKIPDTGGKYEDNAFDILKSKRKSFFQLLRSDPIIKTSRSRRGQANAINNLLSNSFQVLLL